MLKTNYSSYDSAKRTLTSVKFNLKHYLIFNCPNTADKKFHVSLSQVGKLFMSVYAEHNQRLSKVFTSLNTMNEVFFALSRKKIVIHTRITEENKYMVFSEWNATLCYLDIGTDRHRTRSLILGTKNALSFFVKTVSAKKDCQNRP